MTFWIITTVSMAVYMIGFVGVMWMHIAMEAPVTFGLIMLRSLLWPLYLFFGIPKGRRE